MTLIALTAQNRRSITPHAGMCRNFLLFEVEDGCIRGPRLIELDREQTFHELQDGQAHPLDGVDAVITAGMGSGLQRKLARRGVQAFVTSETDPQRAVELFSEGRLPIQDIPESSHQHHSHGGHGCGHCNCAH